MSDPSREKLLQQLEEGRTELVFDLLAAGVAANFKNTHGIPLIRLCAYYGDVSAIEFLYRTERPLEAMGSNFDLGTAAFHGHWRLCLFPVGTRRKRKSGRFQNWRDASP